MLHGMTIGTLAKTAGTKAETIRFYEQEGLLPPPARSSANYRLYDTDSVRRLVFIRRARELGFALETIRMLLKLADQPDHSCGDIDALVSRQLAEVERKISELACLRDELVRLRDRCSVDRTVA